MQFSSKTAKIAIVAMAFLLASFTLMTMTTQAQTTYTNNQDGSGMPLPAGVTPDVAVTTYAYLSVRPNPIGVGQTLLFNIWTTPAIDGSCRMSGFTVRITKPDGTKDTVGPMYSYWGDCTAWFEYVVDQVGTWKLQFDFPGTYFPAGNYTVEALYRKGQVIDFDDSRWYKPSQSPVTELIVQQEPVLSWPPAPLPTDYWTRPVRTHLREWWPILGNYPWSGSGEGFPDWPTGTNYFKGNTKYDAWVLAPNSAHIVWKRMDAIYGLVGTEAGIMGLGAAGGPGDIAAGSRPGLIYSGRCYQTLTVPVDGVPMSCAVCYDLRTGEQYYAIPTAQGGTTPSTISIIPLAVSVGSGVDPIGVSGGVSVELLSVGTRLLKINPVTGAVTTNVTGMAGTLIGNYVISMQTNNTATGPRLINWTTVGTSTNFTSRIVENRSVAFTSIASNVDWQAGVFGTMSVITPPGAPGTYAGLRVIGYSIKTGQMTCNVTDTLVPYATSEVAVDHGKIACLMQNGYAAAYDLSTGKREWISQQTFDVGGYPWGTWGAYSSASYGGNYILSLYDGIYAFNWETGKISWRYSDPSVPYETPYGGYNPFNAGVSIADGKIFAHNIEHSQSQPIIRGWKLHCINATTGEGIWNISGPMIPGAMADGYLTAGSQDGYMYVFGKGKSATTVTAPDVVVTKGTGVVIKGTVLDISPGQPGTPCVSKDSMATQMEYLHMQFPVDGIWHNLTMTGVPVTLTAIDSTGNYVNIGKATTSGYYGTYEMAWVPPAEGTYKIIASFAGDDSYGSSAASTAVVVGPAPAPIQFPEQIAPQDYTMTIAAGVIAIIFAVALVGLLLFVTLRKR